MAVVALGHPNENSSRSGTGDGTRDSLEEKVFFRK